MEGTTIANLVHADFENLKIDALQAMNSIMMVWQYVSSKTIKTCFAQSGLFLSSVDANPIKSQEQILFQRKTGQI